MHIGILLVTYCTENEFLMHFSKILPNGKIAMSSMSICVNKCSFKDDRNGIHSIKFLHIIIGKRKYEETNRGDTAAGTWIELYTTKREYNGIEGL